MFHLSSMLHRVFLGLLVAVLTCGLFAQVPAPAEDIRGPKALVEIPVPQKPPILLWSCVGGGVLLLALTAYLWKRRALQQRLKSPREIALTSLAELETSREVITAEVFANCTAQTVRQYIAARFGLAAPRRTTEEFLRDLASQQSSPLLNESEPLRAFLKSCDLAKFAGSHLNSTQRDELLQAARSFIHSTSQAVTS
ncbi:MAG: hypothetical protein RLZZ398_1938 [Verrucomicrobiota bacterium]|jgi:hypothetical protein